MSFALNLKLERENNHLTKTAMAKYLGISLTAYSLYEKGEREPPLKNLKKISRILKVPIDYLVNEVIETKDEAFEIAKVFWKEIGFELSKSNGVVTATNMYLSKPLTFEEDDFIDRTEDYYSKYEYSYMPEYIFELILYCFEGLDKNLIIENGKEEVNK